MKRMLLLFTVFSLIFCIFPGKVLAQKVWGLYDRNFDKSKLHVQRVAIIPNRLPLTMQEPEYWRQYNWEKMRGEFTRRGFDVVDYSTTLEAVFNSGLPLEDTGASEEKYNTCARLLDVDVIVMPYYSIGFDNHQVLLAFNKFRYQATISLQFYARDTNIFFLRSDSCRHYTVETFWQTLGSALAYWGFSEKYVHDPGGDWYYESNDEVVGWVGVGFVVFNMIKSLYPPTDHWGKAFDSAIRHGLQPFFAVYQKGNFRRLPKNMRRY